MPTRDSFSLCTGTRAFFHAAFCCALSVITSLLPDLRMPSSASSFSFFAMSFAYFVVFPVAFGFFAGYTPAGVQMMTDIDK